MDDRPSGGREAPEDRTRRTGRLVRRTPLARALASEGCSVRTWCADAHDCRPRPAPHRGAPVQRREPDRRDATRRGGGVPPRGVPPFVQPGGRADRAGGLRGVGALAVVVSWGELADVLVPA